MRSCPGQRRLHPGPPILAVALTAALLLQTPPAPSGAGDRGVTVVVGATVETDPVPHAGDAADDPAIWVHPTDPSLSTIIGTDKDGGLAVYDLAGKQLQYMADGKINNVDLRVNFPLGGQAAAVVVATNASDDSVAVYRVNPTTRHLENVAARPIRSEIRARGLCLYQSRTTGKYYAFGTGGKGAVEQWELFDNGSGRVDARKVRTFSVGRHTEGCVADDALDHVYLADEKVGIWKYGAEPDAGERRTPVDSTGPGGHLTRDVEGLAIYDAGGGTGYLIASSQGSNTFVVYQRAGNNAYVLTFAIGARRGIDAVENTDGIDVTSAPLGPAFPEGLFVAQDGRNDGGNQNFKLVPWETIASAVRPQRASDAFRLVRQRRHRDST
jgi:3-phytase